MVSEQDTTNIHKILDKHGKQLSDIQATLQKIAVQDEQIRAIQEDVRKLELKHDQALGPGGSVSHALHFQASCPRQQLKWMWMIVIPMGLSILGVTIRLIGWK